MSDQQTTGLGRILDPAAQSIVDQVLGLPASNSPYRTPGNAALVDAIAALGRAQDAARAAGRPHLSQVITGLIAITGALLDEEASS